MLKLLKRIKSYIHRKWFPVNKCYVLCRKDLGEQVSPIYPAVQGGHAVAQLYEEGKTGDWKNEYIYYLGVENEEELKKWMYLLESRNIPYSKFVEPDVGFQVTSIATIGNEKLYKKLELL